MHLISLCLISIILLSVSSVHISADPIVSHTQGTNGRAEKVRALITAKHLNTGESTKKDKRLAAQIRAMGRPGDNCGHIVARVLGGPMKPYNLFPQNARINGGDFIEKVEGHMQKFLELDVKSGTDERTVDYTAELIYADQEDTRPHQIRFNIYFKKDGKLVPITEIPITRKHHVPSNPYFGIIPNPVD